MYIRSAILLVLAVYTAAKQCDERYICPDTATCCHLPSGKYGCCPLTDAICCQDGKSCCPSGSTCDVEKKTCTSSRGEITRMHGKHHAIESNEDDEEDTENTICPDGLSVCPLASTCCELIPGRYSCCPFSQATCCFDHIHCCPSGTVCSGDYCWRHDKDIFGSKRVESSRKFPATPRIVKRATDYRNSKPRMTQNEIERRPVECGVDRGCSRGHTCCVQYEQNGQIEHSCCPMDEATCCSHGCCPKGYSCTKDGRSCQKRALTEDEQYLQFLKKSWD